MLECEPIEHVALAAAAAPGIIKKAAQMAQILGQACLRAASLAFSFQPAQVVFQLQVPERRICAQAAQCTTQCTAHVDDRSRSLASDLVEIAEVPLDKRIHR